MDNDKRTLTSAEWNVMECLWTLGSCTGRDAVDYLAGSADWTRSTTLTMLRRMSEKGLISCQEQDGVNTYAPLLAREDASIRETDSFLNRVYHGSVSMMLSAFTKKHPLTQSEIDELMAILEEAKRND
ncbi:MAG: BlaI/MecI/CopY family transcriptional regulator [Oscillospiraceae bacterium]|nr:BlaI/MecI/CopY family transcriptional regulator [Oscillospiraceae bacterium]